MNIVQIFPNVTCESTDCSKCPDREECWGEDFFTEDMDTGYFGDEDVQ